MTLTKGQENLEETIQACQRIIAALNGMPNAAEHEGGLVQVVTTLEGIREKFFLKTNPSIPATNACKKETTQIEAIIGQKNWGSFPQALSKLQQTTEALVKKAKMEGATFT